MDFGRDSWEGATQFGVWVAVSRFLKFPILGNFAEFGKSRLRPSGRTFPRLEVGGYTRRSDGEQRERASSKSARSSLPPAPSWRVWVRTHRAYPFWKALPSGCAFYKPSAGGLPGLRPRHLPAVTCKGNQVPVYGVLLSRGSLRSAGESTLTARATSAPFQHRPCLCRAASEKILQALGSTP